MPVGLDQGCRSTGTGRSLDARLCEQSGFGLVEESEACQAADELAEATSDLFHPHPDAVIITSFPGLGDLTGARVLAEIGDDRTR